MSRVFETFVFHAACRVLSLDNATFYGDAADLAATLCHDVVGWLVVHSNVVQRP